MSDAGEQLDDLERRDAEHKHQTLEQRVAALEEDREAMRKHIAELIDTTVKSLESVDQAHVSQLKAYDGLAEGMKKVVVTMTKRLHTIEAKLGIRRPS